MSEHREEHLDLCAGYALGILEPAERARLEEHLSPGCPTCEAELQKLSEATILLAASAPAARPSAALRDRVLAAVVAEAGPGRAPAPTGRGRVIELKPTPTMRWGHWVWGAVAAALAITSALLFNESNRLRSQLESTRQDLGLIARRLAEEERLTEVLSAPGAKVAVLELDPRRGAGATGAGHLRSGDEKRRAGVRELQAPGRPRLRALGDPRCRSREPRADPGRRQGNRGDADRRRRRSREPASLRGLARAGRRLSESGGAERAGGDARKVGRVDFQRSLGPVRDRNLLFAVAFLRALATGLIGVLIGVYLARLRLGAAEIGVVVGAGLAGVAVATLIGMLWADQLGRRRFLIALSLLGAAGGLVFAFSSGVGILAGAAFLGMLNGMGRDRGAAIALEQAVLPATTTDSGRTRVIAWYNVLQDAGHALGSLLAGLPVLLRSVASLDELASLRAALVLFATLMLATAVLYLRLSPAVEVETGRPAVRISPETRRVLWRISSLFAIDSLGGGFLTTALLSFFFFERFGVGEGVIGLLFFGARILNAFSHLGAAWLASRIGLVNTMVFTHIPSSLLLATVAIAPSFPVAAVLFLLREGLVEMDVPTRQSYVMAVVRPEERTFASSLTALVRMGAWAVAPSFAGWMMQSFSLAAPLFIGAGMKIAYDLSLFAAFRGLKPPEEMAP